MKKTIKPKNRIGFPFLLFEKNNTAIKINP